MPRPARERSGPQRVRLRPQNPFDLIRLLARSQSDPRKAVAELVQNSLDAGARRVEIVWFNDKGRRTLKVWDDGEGVFPEMDRVAALRQIARTIGHSHKRSLTPSERREQMVLGKYGIGLIGFWSVGEVLEMKSRVRGGPAYVLRLKEDRAQGEVFPSRARLLGEPETFTEVVVRSVHEGAVNRIRPPRLQAYLANELRGQLLERGAVVHIRDKVARGRARKEFTVEPRPYLGLPLEEWRELEVAGFESARVELYLVPIGDERRGVVSLSCGGTVVLDDIAEIDGIEAPRAPWSTGRFEGVIDFPDLHVSPSTRRGFAHDEPVAAFLAALEGLERELDRRIEEERRSVARRREESVAREIRRAFRSVARELPDYDFFAVGAARGANGSAAATPGAGGPSTGEADVEDEVPEPPSPQEGEPIGSTGAPSSAVNDHERELRDDMLFPPGPLARLQSKPRVVRVPLGGSRALKVRPLDADGRPCRGDVELSWSLDGPGELEVESDRATYSAPDRAGSEPIRIRVRASQEEHVCEVTIDVRLVEPSFGAATVGIPEPRAVTAPGESWRSRLVGDRWEYNDAHRDYLAVADVEARRLRYLIHLFGKEIVLRNFGRPGDAETLERFVEVLTWLDAGEKRGT